MADSETSKEDRQLPASERRLRQAADEGRVARSRDAAHVLVLGAGVGTVILAGANLRGDLIALLRQSVRFDQAIRGEVLEATARLAAPLSAVLLPLALILGVTTVGAIAAGAIPGGLQLSWKALGFKGSRLDPIGGVKRIFSLRNLVEFGKLALLAVVFGLIGVWFAAATLPEFAALSLGSLAASVGAAASLVNGGLGLLILLLVALAVFDVPFQWFRHRSELKMTREEARQEAKETEGDPHVRGQIRSRQREAARRRMLAAVPAADVVVVNPTHYAVAIRYDDSMGAPRVVAKGVDLLAARIQAIAREAGVPVLEAPPLARALYAHVELDHEVPRALYAAIAQVLAYVYQLKRWVPGRAPMPAEPTDLPVPAGMDPKQAEAGGAA
ncbi:MAG: flagellar biosynthesis protein FlhB [Lautropia sp.]